MLLLGFDPRISGVRSNRSAKRATATVQAGPYLYPPSALRRSYNFFYFRILRCRFTHLGFYQSKKALCSCVHILPRKTSSSSERYLNLSFNYSFFSNLIPKNPKFESSFSKMVDIGNLIKRKPLLMK